ncbi:MAG TPA: Asp-tRNA(Asn)/Glu-tRNA(Gln) amidotransferase subunit GatA [Candidatus Dorea intestinavium]|nr:Asp-tRNA(Asn)/Glu-tRNA(Gln) amidotransferase subunit GatA [Candidatus Dorea intestinavium]
MDILNFSAVELGKEIKNKRISSKEVLDAYFAQIEKEEKEINAFITLTKEKAYQKGEEVQRKINRGEPCHPLAGVPIAIKDNIITKGVKTTCGSKMLENFVPTYNATVMDRLEEAGLIMLGKTNTDEFAMGSTTETSYYGVTKNPINPKHVPGGSSGGSCAAVRAQECALALGSDTGGSIRQPASHCQVVGMKPSYGSVSRYGLISYASSFDQIGPIASNVKDCVMLLDTITDYDEKDSTSKKRTAKNFTQYLINDIKGMKIGIQRQALKGVMDKDVERTFLESIRLLERAGASVSAVDFALTNYELSTYYIIASAQASSNLSRFDGVKYGFRASNYQDLEEMLKASRSLGFGEEVKKRILLGTFALSSSYYEDYYAKAQKVRTLIKNEYQKAFEYYDLILTPVAAETAPLLGRAFDHSLTKYVNDNYTIGANLTGIPAISVPAGVSKTGLPIGIQLLSASGREDQLIQASYTFETIRRGKDVK